MFSKKFLFLSLVVVGVLATGCRKEPKIKDEDKEKPLSPPVVTFNVSGGEALGGRDVNTARFASALRAADNSKNSALVKILEDGTLESAISATVPDVKGVDEEYKKSVTNWGKLIDVFLPPKGSNCKDVYLLFDDITSFPAVDPEDSSVGGWSLSYLLAIHEDGTYTDILADSPWRIANTPIDNRRNVQIAPDGSLYVLFREGGGWEYYIRKYNPSTKAVSEICRFGRSAPMCEETKNWTEADWSNNSVFVPKMKMSKDGKWAYIQVRMNQNKEYIHVVSIDKPSVFTDIVLDTGSQYKYTCWDYDELSNKLYYLQITRDSSGEETSRIIYSADHDGKNQKVYKDLGTTLCYSLFAVEKNTQSATVWIRYGRGGLVGDTNSYEVFINAETFISPEQMEKFEVPVKDGLSSLDDDIVKGKYIYMCCDGGEYDYELQHREKNAIVRVSMTDKTYIDYSKMLPEKDNINL